MSMHNECGKKKRYSSFDVAWNDCRAMKKRTGDTFHIYRCRFCNAFHIGHAKNPAKQETYVSEMFLQAMEGVERI